MPGGSKRKRKAPPAATTSNKEDSKPAAVRKKTANNFLVTLYALVRQLENSATAATEQDESSTMQSAAGALLLNNKAWALAAVSPEGGDETANQGGLPAEQAYCFALVLVTHALHRLTTAAAESSNDDSCAIVLAGWSRWLMTRLDRLVPAYSRWDKATGACRHLLARMIATITGACLTSLDGSTDGDSATLVAATLSLEEALLNMGTCLPVFGQGNEYLTDAVAQDLEHFPVSENTSKMVETSLRVGGLLADTVQTPGAAAEDDSAFWNAFGQANTQIDICEWTPVEWALLNCLTQTGTASGETATSSSSNAKPTKKRGGRRQHTDTKMAVASWMSPWDAFCKENKMSFTALDGRLTARRWAPVMMDWYLQAGPRLLAKAQSLLSNDNNDDAVLEDLTNKDGWTIPGKVLPVFLVGRWARILAESASRSGHRPPSLGGFEAYVRPFLPTGLRPKGKSAKKMAKPDVRDITMVTIHSLLEAHAECLDLDDAGGVSYCLWVPDIIRDLAAAASSALSGSESAECADRLEHAAAAYIPTILGATTNHDWLLLHFGMTKLEQLLASCKDETSSLPTQFQSSMVEAHGALPTPSTLFSKPAAKKKKTETPKKWCSYAGVYPKAESGKGLYEKIAIHVRGYGIRSKSKQSKNTKQSNSTVGENMITQLFALAEQAVNRPARPVAAKKGKGRAASAARPGKRRRKEPAEPPVTVARESSEAGEDPKTSTKSVLSVVRAKLLSKILQVLDFHVAAPVKCLLRTLLPSTGDFFLPKGASLLIELNQKVHNALFSERSFGSPLPETSLLVTDGAIPLNTQVVASHESEVWLSLVSLNATVGAGRHDNISMESKHETVLGNSRLELYKLIACGGGARKPMKDSWPLWIPTPSRVFVSCNLCAENMIGGKVDTEPDHFILEGFLNTLNGILEEPTDLVQESSKEARFCVEEEVPLSLLDARVIVGACARLPDHHQAEYLDNLLDCVNEHLKDFVDGPLSDFVVEKDVSAFLGRVVTTLTHLVTLVGCTSDYQRFIQRALCDSFSRRLTKWVSTDKHVGHTCFMGVLSNWEYTDLPEGVRSKESLPGAIFPKFLEMVEASFELGFLSVSFDHGYLLYTAWNAHGRSSLWNPAKGQLVISKISLKNPTSAILAIRNDLCLVHRRIRSDQGVLAKTSISKSLDRSLGAGSPRTIVDNLKTLIEKGSETVLKLLDMQGSAEKNTISIESCALLHSLCVCISFGVSSLTVAESNFFADLTSKHLSRPRGFSVDSVDSDVDSTCSNDAKVNASERLAEVCRAAGAVPAHPDWLDSSCSLRYGISRPEARVLATTALRAFTKLVRSGVNARNDHITVVLDGSERRNSSSQVFLQATSLLYSLSGSVEKADDGALETIASLCRMSPDTAHMLVCGLSTGLQTCTSDFWCPNASQQIIGEMHSLIQGQLILPSEIGFSELRATGDWEIALATSLLSGLFDIEANTNLHVLFTSRWTTMIASTLEWMVPACALLRFTLQSGGKAHPLKSMSCAVEDYVAQEDSCVEGVNASTRLTGTQRDSVLEAIHIITNPVTSKEKVSQALAYHLLGTNRESRCLNHIGKVVASVQVFMALSDASKGDEESDVGVKNLISKIVVCLKGVAGVGPPEWPLARLLAACAHDTKLEVASLSLGKLNITDIVSSELKSWSQGTSHGEDASSFVSDTVSAFAKLLHRPSALSRDSLGYLGAVLSSLSVIERQEGIDPKLGRLLIRSISKSPGGLFQEMISTDGGFRADDEDLLLDLSNIYASPFFARVSDALIAFSNSLYEALRGVVDSCKKGKIPAGILNLWFLCGAYCGKLDEIGGLLFAGQSSGSLDRVDATHNFVSFVSGLASALSSGHTQKPLLKSTNSSTEGKLCSFAVKEGFQEQFWYNCRTCGLTGEKGCCSTCARICHRGHDVVYARHSSFFCDCGAETAKPGTESPAQLCKCLTLLNEEDGNHLLLPEMKPQFVSEGISDVANAASCARAAVFFRDRSQKSLKRVKGSAGRNNWLSKMSAALVETVETWKHERALLDEQRPLVPAAVDKAPGSNCVRLDGFTTLHCSRQGVFDIFSAGDNAEPYRRVLAADGRGRLVLCEGPTLRFWAISSMMNNSFANDSMDFLRSDVPFLASTAHNLTNVIGMRLSSDNGHHLLLWSQKDASVFVIQPTWNGVLKRLQIFSQDENPGETVSKCVWLPGIEGFACVGMRDRVQIFKLAENGAVSVVEARLNQSISDVIKDYTLVPVYEGYTVISWKVFCLVEKGVLFQASFCRDDLYNEKKTEANFETNTSLAIPNSFENDVGQRLDFLEKGGLLICQLSKSGTSGLQVENGQVKRAFSLLPTCPLNFSEGKLSEIVGPYSHWHSLETNSGGNEAPVLCLFCTGRVKGAMESVVLQIVLGDLLVIKACPDFLKGCVEGMAVCSTPMIENERSPFDMSATRSISERAVLSLITSTGNFTSLIEMGSSPYHLSYTTERHPVLIFETLQKISSPERLSFQVDGVSDETNLASRLLGDSDGDVFVSPRPEFTINIFVKNTLDAQDGESLIIAALRVQVGRVSTARIPSRIFVEGRKIALKQGTSDWYAAVLTAQEIAHTVRKGFVTVKVDAGPSGNTPVIDALEVYATSRSSVASWMQTKQNRQPIQQKSHVLGSMLSGMKSLRNLNFMVTDKSKETLDKELARQLVYETAIGCPPELSETVDLMVTAFEWKENSQAFLDDTRVAACADFVMGPPPDLTSVMGGAGFAQGQRFVSRLEDCLRVSCHVAKYRPNGYLKALEKTRHNLGSIAIPGSVLLMENAAVRHIATDSLISQLAELALFEMSISFLQGKKLDNFSALQRLLRSENSRILGAACRAVRLFCEMFKSPQLLEYPDPFATQRMVAVYGCDSCSACPIQGTRYTLAKDDTSFDLCESCYGAAAKFASSNRSRSRDVLINGKPVGDDSIKLTCAEVRMMQPVHDQQHSHSRSLNRQQVYEDFGNLLQNSIFGLLSEEMKSKGFIQTDLIQLSTDLILLAGSSRLERKKRLAKKIVEALSVLLSLPNPGGRENVSTRKCINTLSQLIVPDSEIRTFFSSPHSSSVETPQLKRGGTDVLCETHHCAIEVRRFRANGDEGKRFVCCKSDRCGLFSWVQSSPEDAAANLESVFDKEASRHIWELVTTKSEEEKCVADTLCVIVEKLGDCHDPTKPGDACVSSFFPYTAEQAANDVADGVLSALSRTHNVCTSQFLQRAHLPPTTVKSLSEVSLELLSLSSPVRIESLPSWHQVLCKMIGSEQPSALKSLAKTTLFRLCGADHDSYHRVKDAYALSRLMRTLNEHSGSLIKRALIVKQKAHACGQDWREEFNTTEQNGLDFLGVKELLQEGSLPVAIRSSLDDALSIAKRRSQNWQSFSHATSQELKKEKLYFSPLSVIFSLAVLLGGDSQLKALKLCELASFPVEPPKQGRRHSSQRSTHQNGFPFGSLSAGDALLAFSDKIVLNGDSADIRRTGCGIANSLIRHASKEAIRKVFPKLMVVLEKCVAESGKNGIEFVALLSSAARELKGDSNLLEYASVVEDYILKQMLTVRHHRANEDFIVFDSRSSSTPRKRFDLGFCVHCSRPQVPVPTGTKRGEDRGKSSATARANEGSRKSTRVAGQGDSQKVDWVEGQVSPFSRARLHSLRESHASDEFSTYVALKNRLVISEISTEVHDARGRLVKCISVFSTPIPVRGRDGARELMADAYKQKWEELGTMQLSRGASRASITLPKPVIAANLKIEYTDFHERPGDAGQSDKNFVVHCPRCSRIVNNDAGVCASCGEMAFQCRKCRHVNYGRLDAFLCTECGYCASGTFSFDMMAATATNAVAITNDVEYKEQKMRFAACIRIREDARYMLKEKHSSFVKASKKTEKNGNGDFWSEDLRRVYDGQVPQIPWQKNEHLSALLANLGRQGSVVRAVARPENLDMAGRGSTDRRSTLNALLRGGGGSSSSSRRHSDDIVVQQIRAEIDEDESEILGLLEGSGRAGVDSSDPISRLLARVRSRHEQSENDHQDDGGGGTSPSALLGGKSKSSTTAKECLDICERLHLLMREAEREAYELQRRIKAWECLNRNDLPGVESHDKSHGFSPCRCWNCSSAVASCLLSLWQNLFQADPSAVQPSEALVEMLLQNETSSTPSSSRSLLDSKRLVVESIATQSSVGAQLVLNGLRKRLGVGQDVYAAELLGRILESTVESPLRSEFVDLAAEQLEQQQSV